MIRRENFIVAIDGPSSSGKSTLASKIAKFMNFEYLNTGILYRFLAAELLNSHRTIEQILQQRELESQIHFFLQNQSIDSNKLKTEEIAKLASIISNNATVRSFLLPIQRTFAYSSIRGAVLEGRDITSVVIPDADFKIFITANIAIRARRRFIEFQRKKMYRTVLSSVLQRDLRDLNRKISPLIKSESNFFVDTSNLTKQESLIKIIKKIKTFL